MSDKKLHSTRVQTNEVTTMINNFANSTIQTTTLAN